MHVFDILEKPDSLQPAAVIVIAGPEAFLRQLATQAVVRAVFGEQEIPHESFDGEQAQWRDIADELATVSLFASGGPRVAVVHAADDFISKNRGQLEKYVERPAGGSVLVLIADAFPANTRLYKAVSAQHLIIQCKAPERGSGSSSQPDSRRIEKWLCRWASDRHAATLMPSAAEVLLELVGPEFGILDQELAKLGAVAVTEGKITPEMVHEYVGGWRMKTGWDLVDAMLEGRAGDAVTQLERLVQAGESPVAIAGQVSWALRQYAAATRIVQRSERSGVKMSVRDALAAAGVRAFGDNLAKAEQRLRGIGRVRGLQLYPWLIEADLALKGSHSSPERARWLLERLFLRLAKETAPPPPAKTSRGG